MTNIDQSETAGADKTNPTIPQSLSVANSLNEEAPAVSPRRYALLSIVAAVLTIMLLSGAYFVTHSVSLFSAAAESLTNLLAAVAALIALTIAERPPDEEHSFGHTKAEYFSSGFESSLILLAAVFIAWEAIQRLFDPQPLENVGVGLAVSIAASALNGGVAFIMLRAGKRLRSITLRADGQHLLTDVYTTLGVIIGVVLITLTGWHILDPIIALIVAANIVRIAIALLKESAHGLLDTALTQQDQAILTGVLPEYKQRGIGFHAVRSRVAATRRFIYLHVLVPGNWTIQQGHNVCEEIEASIREALPQSTILTHLEPKEDPRSWEDVELDRPAPNSSHVW